MCPHCEYTKYTTKPSKSTPTTTIKIMNLVAIPDDDAAVGAWTGVIVDVLAGVLGVGAIGASVGVPGVQLGLLVGALRAHALAWLLFPG